MTFGPLFFAAPLALIGLLALPLIWWLLRATPPRPRAEVLPSLRLLDGVVEEDTTPARTPWYVLALRLLALALAALGLASPLWSPQPTVAEGEDNAPLLLVIDDGWTSAARWSAVTDAAEATLREVPRDTAVHLLTTAPRTRPQDPAQRLTALDAISVVQTLEPQAWLPDRADAAARLEAAGLEAYRPVWITDGLDEAGQDALADVLSENNPLSARVVSPQGAFAITGVQAVSDGARVSVTRLTTGTAISRTVSARTLDGQPVASARAAFEPDDLTAEAVFTLPNAALNRIAQFALPGEDSAGAVWLWDSAAKRQRVGLVSPGSLAQPLLEDVYYIRKALQPFAEVDEADLLDLIVSDPDAIILTDTGALSEDEVTALTDWVEGGGALIRFAGPRMAEGAPVLLPVTLRQSARALGGTLNWDQPQALAPFPDSSPFAGLPVPPDAFVRQQVLAQPTPDLDNYTWARLADGSPIVTAAPRGQGTVILFHVTASPAWSDLPYTGVFVEMLRRAIAAGQGRSTAAEGEGLYAPLTVLTGTGRLATPDADATPLAGETFYATPLGPTHPPGFYDGPAGARARNTATGALPRPVAAWPAGTRILGDAAPHTIPLAGPLLLGALGLFLIDVILALFIAGRFRRIGRRGSAHTAAALALALIAGAGVLAAPPAGAQEIQRTTSSKAEEAARQLRLAYIETGDAALDAVTKSGLEQLSLVLFQRSSVEPAEPHSVNLETDVLEMYPLLYYAVPDASPPQSALAMDRLNAYLRTGGVLIIDARRDTLGSGDGTRPLEGLLPGLDIAGLIPVPSDHTLKRTFYLLDTFPGRFSGGRVWIERPPEDDSNTTRITRVIVGSADWAGAWAVDYRGRPLKSVDGGEEQREWARRVGVNFVMYALTGTYKDDQVHVPELLERMNKEDKPPPEEVPVNPAPGGPQ